MKVGATCFLRIAVGMLRQNSRSMTWGGGQLASLKKHVGITEYSTNGCSNEIPASCAKPAGKIRANKMTMSRAKLKEVCSFQGSKRNDEIAGSGNARLFAQD